MKLKRDNNQLSRPKLFNSFVVCIFARKGDDDKKTADVTYTHQQLQLSDG